MENNKKKLQILDIIESSVAAVQHNEEKINKLNVFPVPDGDTGSNMLATLLSAWNNIDAADSDIKKIMKDFAHGALLGARGNSGVITSQIIRGFSEGINGSGSDRYTSTESMRKILRSVREYSYKSVSNPIEGTILSLVRALDEKYDRTANSALEAFENIHHIANAALENTPNQLKILKEAGVVDSGGYGLLMMIEGVIQALKGNPYKIKTTNTGTQTKEAAIFTKADAFKNIGYCSEFIMTLKKPEDFNDEKTKEWLNSIGDSVVYIREWDVLKVHVHTLTPGKLLSDAQKFGEFSKIKIENMTSQVSNQGHTISEDEISLSTQRNAENKLGIIAVSNGTGLDELNKQLGVTHIVSGGQTMNPSVEDFIKLINKMNNKEIVLLPNNGNIILTANTVQKMVTDKKIYVLETKSLQQGIVAMQNMNDDMINFEDYKEGVIEAFKNINEAVITNAIRDVEMNGVKVKEGDYLALSNRKVVVSNKDMMYVVTSTIDELIKTKEDAFAMTIFYGNEVSKELRDRISTYIDKKYSGIDVRMEFGGQNVYQFLIFVE